jgi:DNA-binding HxlR family transcriptional regulator
MSEPTLSEFLDSSGGIPVLLACPSDADGRVYGEIEETLNVASSTASKRKTEAERLGLIEQVTKIIDAEHANTRRYRLTEDGIALSAVFEAMGLHKKYESYVKTEREYEDACEQVVEWIEEDINRTRKVEILQSVDQGNGPVDQEELSGDAPEPVSIDEDEDSIFDTDAFDA